MDSRVTTYKRLIRSAQAEQILSKSKVYLDIPKLRPHIIGSGVDKTSELYRYLKYASQHGSYISTEYNSKQKTTARMFTKKGNLNLITLSDDRILSALRSRYDEGYILCLDYNNFEPSIIRCEIGDVMPESIHDWAVDLFHSDKLPRKVIKLYNMQLLYSTDFVFMVSKLSSVLKDEYECDDFDILEYVERLASIREFIADYVALQSESFENAGFITNSYGRKIYPRDKNNIFNNAIQSIGSEILVEAIIALNDYTQDKEMHLLFHRFDSLYIDISKVALYKHLSKIKGIMEGVNQNVNLTVGISVGKNITDLKELDLG